MLVPDNYVTQLATHDEFPGAMELRESGFMLCSASSRNLAPCTDNFRDDVLSACFCIFQVTNEIVRQLLEQNGFYSTEKPIGDMKFLVDCNYIGAMNTPGGGKNDIPNRLKRQFNLYYVPLPSKASINNVYGTLVAGRFTADLFDADTIDLSKRLVPMTIALWNKVQV